ncbi:MAG: N-acetylmuramic acid 6-phosphate etherase [Ignavibacteriales bacterium]|nr:MAG: N-acetylmuramic acid 6-phosphate etherase [Ignavibacteriales bacterium]
MSSDSESNSLFDEIKNLSTEQRNPRSLNIDSLPVSDILKLINDEDKIVATAVEKELPYIEQAIEKIVESLKNGGRLLYFGAGTSGRLGVLDAVECPPTFGTPPGLIEGFIAGGKEAMFKAQEGAEDSEELGAKDLTNANVTEKDIVCGLAASRRTPYVIGAIKKAKQNGAVTLFVTCNPRSSFNFPEVDIAICPEVGPEIIMGSTRMKSGTAQKMVLNMLTTTAMIRLGKVFENMMIDLQLTNKKLVERAKRILMIITNASYEEAGDFLKKANGNVKSAIVMKKCSVDFEKAKEALSKSDGFVRRAIELLS